MPKGKTIGQLQEERAIEQQILSVYEEAPIVRVKERVDTRFTFKEYYRPTPAQQEQLIQLVEQLPVEKQQKYVTIPEEPITPIQPEPSPIVSRRPTTYGRTAVPHVPKPPSEKVLKVGRAVLAEPIPREQIVSPHEILKEPVTTTLFKVTEALLHPEQVIVALLPEKKREAYLETVEPLTHVRETPALKSFEEFAYVPSGFVGAFERYVQPGIPTPSTAVLQPIFEGGKLTEAQFLAEHPGYALGALVGEWVQAKYIFGPMLERGWRGVKAVTPKAVKDVFKFGKVGRVIHKTDLWVKGHLPERFRMKPISPGEIVIPTVPERVSVSWFKTSKTAFEMTLFPRTGGVWVGKTFLTEPMKAPMKHLFYIGGKISVGYLRELSYVSPAARQEKLLPFVTQTQLTRMGVLPYIPKVTVARGLPLAARTFVGFSVSALAKTLVQVKEPTRPKRRVKAVTLPKVVAVPEWQPTLALEREKLRTTTFEVVEPKRKKKALIVPIPALKSVVGEVPKIEAVPSKLLQKEREMLVAIPKLKQVPKQIPAPFRPPPRPQPTFPPTRFLFKPPEAMLSRRRARLFGAWYLKKHPLPTGTELSRRLLGKSKRKRGKKKRGYII